MRRGTWVLLLAVIALAGCGGGDEDAAVTVQMNETNGSGQTGTATLTASSDNSIQVVLELTELEFASQPAHIHEGTCAEYAALTEFEAQLATVKDSLREVVEGKSTTDVGLTPLATRTTGGYSINVHEPTGSFPTTACGDIPKR